MTTSILALSLLLTVSLFGGNEPGIAVYMDFDGRPPSRSIDEMKREVESLLQPSGLHIHWRQLTESGAGESFSDLFVFRFQGMCSVETIHLLFSELGPYGDAVVLGAAKTVEKQILPFGSLQCDPIRRSVAPEILGLAHREREAVFGRALGRVMAHELFHMLTKTAKHSDGGLFKAAQRRDDLVARQFTFDEQERSELRRIGEKMKPR